ncbi:MAG: DUF445 family protein [Defluviitaleaceae bacterium]|nr:DUF445 family protein [Defluviitaleaceae bacterium]
MLTYIIPPLLGAIVALGTNWIAIVMLFRPHREWRVFGLRVPFTPGLIPREQGNLGRKMGEAIEKHLLTPEVLVGTLADPSRWPLPDMTLGQALDIYGGKAAKSVNEKAKAAVDKLLPQASDFVANLHDRFPYADEKLADLTRHITDQSMNKIASIFVKKDKMYPRLKEWLVGYLANEENRDLLRARLHEAIDQYSASTPANDMHEKILNTHFNQLFALLPLEKILTMAATFIAKHLPIAQMVEQKMATYDVAEAEEMILSVVGRELRIIVLLGGVFGFLIGLLSIIPLASG